MFAPAVASAAVCVEPPAELFDFEAAGVSHPKLPAQAKRPFLEFAGIAGGRAFEP